MNARRGLIWTGFWVFVVVSWAAAGFFWFIAGWSPCQATGSCSADRIIGVLTVLLMPIQVLLAVWLKQCQIHERG